MRAFPLLIGLGLVFIVNPCEAGSYPSAPSTPKTSIADVYGSQLYREVAAMLDSPTTTSSNKIAKLDKIERSLSSEPLPLVSAPERMSLPKALVDGEDAFLGGLDSASFWQSIASTPDEASMLMSGIMIYKTLPPSLSLARMKERAAIANSTLLDLLRLQAFVSAPPGAKLTSPPSKADWEALHKSSNPCYRLIALEVFDSVEQSPGELLSLYRECLFGACSFLEARALAAIQSNKDNRAEVAQLLEQYASTKPVNDGTLPGLRNPFRDPGHSAKELAVAIRAAINSGDTQASRPQVTAEPKTTVGQPSSQGQNRSARGQAQPLGSDETRSTLGTIVVVMIAVALGALWLLLKRRTK